MISGYSFHKTERLTQRNRIDYVFKSGKPISNYPIKILWIPSFDELACPAQTLFAVSSKKFKKAVDRNRIKRKLKELFRQEKHFLYEELLKNKQQLLISIIYTGNNACFHCSDLKSIFRESIEMLIRSSIKRN
jgi:ribonuclease P protein component